MSSSSASTPSHPTTSAPPPTWCCPGPCRSASSVPSRTTTSRRPSHDPPHESAPTGAPVTTVAVLGAKGRMGSEVVKAVTTADDLDLGPTLDLGDDLDLSGADVAVDFTHPSSV